MSHLIEAYSLSTGLRIEKMHTYEQYFPLPEGVDKFILVASGSGMGAKNYSYFADVLWIIREGLAKQGIKIIQVGGKDDEGLPVDLDLKGQTSLYQLCYLIKRAYMVLCNDTSILHLAGHYDKKVVSIFGLTDPAVSGAYFGNPKNQVYITPEFIDRSPSFNPNEKPSVINEIRPEEIARKISTLIDSEINDVDTLYIGEQYRFNAIEVVPDHIINPASLANHIVNIRYDYGGDENTVYQLVSQRKCNIMTDRPLNVDVLFQLRANIANVIYCVDENHNPAFVEALHRKGLPYILISYLPLDVLNKIKPSYFEFNLIHPKKYKDRSTLPNAEFITEDTEIRSNKFILSKGKIFLSRAHLTKDEPIADFDKNTSKIIDTEAFWKESEFFYIFNRKSLQAQE